MNDGIEYFLLLVLQINGSERMSLYYKNLSRWFGLPCVMEVHILLET